MITLFTLQIDFSNKFFNNEKNISRISKITVMFILSLYKRVCIFFHIVKSLSEQEYKNKGHWIWYNPFNKIYKLIKSYENNDSKIKSYCDDFKQISSDQYINLEICNDLLEVYKMDKYKFDEFKAKYY
jgi:hypothetical protein